MNSWMLTYRPRQGPALVDGSLLRPDTLGLLDLDALAATRLPIGRTNVPLGELFAIERVAASLGDADRVAERPVYFPAAPTLILRHAPPLDHLGALMARGHLIIEGDAGDDLGASMAGGLIRVTGSAGHRVGGPHPTCRRGMTGGEILIDGGCGDFAGFLLRRGLIAVAGRAGRSPGYRMLAGTVVLVQGPVDHPGLEMQRGTIICIHENATLQLGPTFGDGGMIEAGAMPAINVLLRRLRELDWPRGNALPAVAPAKWRLWTGDALELNKGEVLQWLSGS